MHTYALSQEPIHHLNAVRFLFDAVRAFLDRANWQGSLQESRCANSLVLCRYNSWGAMNPGQPRSGLPLLQGAGQHHLVDRRSP